MLWGEALAAAKDRTLWRSIVIAICATGNEEDKKYLLHPQAETALLSHLVTCMTGFRMPKIQNSGEGRGEGGEQIVFDIRKCYLMERTHPCSGSFPGCTDIGVNSSLPLGGSRVLLSMHIC